MSKVIKGIRYVITGILVLILAVNVYVVVQRLAFHKQMPTVFGFASAVVISGSMEPTILVDDMVITQRQTAYVQGDIITYEDQAGKYVTHRIIEISEGAFVTKGDDNNVADQALVNPEQVVGKVFCIIPQAGRVITFAQSPSGMLLLVLIGFGIILWPNVSGSLRDAIGRRKQSAGEEPQEEDPEDAGYIE